MRDTAYDRMIRADRIRRVMTNGSDMTQDDIIYTLGGLTKREYFAAMCLQAMLVDCDNDAYTQKAARIAVGGADALIAELNKETK